MFVPSNGGEQFVQGNIWIIKLSPVPRKLGIPAGGGILCPLREEWEWRGTTCRGSGGRVTLRVTPFRPRMARHNNVPRGKAIRIE